MEAVSVETLNMEAVSVETLNTEAVSVETLSIEAVSVETLIIQAEPGARAGSGRETTEGSCRATRQLPAGTSKWLFTVHNQ